MNAARRNALKPALAGAITTLLLSCVPLVAASEVERVPSQPGQTGASTTAASATGAVVDENGRIHLKATAPAKAKRRKSPYAEEEKDGDAIVVSAPGERERFPARMRFTHPLECRIF